MSIWIVEVESQIQQGKVCITINCMCCLLEQGAKSWTERNKKRPGLQLEHSYAVCSNVQRFHGRGIVACRYFSINAAGLRFSCEKAALILNVPNLKWEQEKSDGRSLTSLQKYSLFAAITSIQVCRSLAK